MYRNDVEYLDWLQSISHLLRNMDIQANKFAGQLLVPSFQLEEKFNEGVSRLRDSDVFGSDGLCVIMRELARYFNVSGETVKIRLLNDGLVGEVDIE